MLNTSSEFFFLLSMKTDIIKFHYGVYANYALNII